jgi:hypothetical protein
VYNRKKEFWDVSEAYKLMSDKFRQGLAHEPDGLIFQPSKGTGTGIFKKDSDPQIFVGIGYDYGFGS